MTQNYVANRLHTFTIAVCSYHDEEKAVNGSLVSGCFYLGFYADTRLGKNKQQDFSIILV